MSAVIYTSHSVVSCTSGDRLASTLPLGARGRGLVLGDDDLSLGRPKQRVHANA
jgi:hypothetical protein